MQVARQIAWEASPGYRPPRAPQAAPARRRWCGAHVALSAGLWAAVVAGALFYVYRHAQVARAGFALTAMRKELQELKSANEALEAQVAELRSIQRIEKRAVELGLQKPVDFRVATVDKAAVYARLAPAGDQAPAQAVAAAPAAEPAQAVAAAPAATPAQAAPAAAPAHAAPRAEGLWARALRYLAGFSLRAGTAEARSR